MPLANDLASSPSSASAPREDSLAWYKTQYEQLESELADFQESSRELEAELEKDVEAAEKRERQLQEKVEALGYEVEEWKVRIPLQPLKPYSYLVFLMSIIKKLLILSCSRNASNPKPNRAQPRIRCRRRSPFYETPIELFN